MTTAERVRIRVEDVRRVTGPDGEPRFIVQLTEVNRIDSVGIYGQLTNGHYGVVAHGWSDKYGEYHPMDRIQIWNSTISEVTHYGVTAGPGTCLQVYNTNITGAQSCWEGVTTGVSARDRAQPLGRKTTTRQRGSNTPSQSRRSVSIRSMPHGWRIMAATMK